MKMQLSFSKPITLVKKPFKIRNEGIIIGESKGGENLKIKGLIEIKEFLKIDGEFYVPKIIRLKTNKKGINYNEYFIEYGCHKYEVIETHPMRNGHSYDIVGVLKHVRN